MKKIMYKAAVLVMLVLAVVFSGITSVKADNSQTDNKQIVYVTDDASILTENEFNNITKICKKTSDSCKMPVFIMTLNTGLDGSNLDSYVKKYINEKYGDSVSDWICYTVDMKSRADRVLAQGKAKSQLTDSDLNTIRKKAEKKLSDKNYYKAFKLYADGVQSKLNPSIVYLFTKNAGIRLLVSLGVAVVAVLIMMFNAKSKMTVESNTYTKDHGFNIREKRDDFINTTVVRRKIESSKSGGNSGGSGHSGVSGGHF